ncbi:hypothetical protein I553_6588 [Mycobacterium xenopi 4042]|uniref:Uncharacterized protein n=1 Tax=Mycobacterium xenopi 4042 TaxID=1299334 RepID=X8BHM0_MYCXE|nr:hypothetical protein I553_6588 [Mycobacterium xenopi 4042]
MSDRIARRAGFAVGRYHASEDGIYSVGDMTTDSAGSMPARARPARSSRQSAAATSLRGEVGGVPYGYRCT